MTIFDVLKYPIGTPPTTDELMDLPMKVYNQMIDDIHCTLSSSLSVLRNRNASNMSVTLSIMLRQPANKAEALRIIQSARNTLMEL